MSGTGEIDAMGIVVRNIPSADQTIVDGLAIMA
jgi:hypothetical protein